MANALRIAPADNVMIALEDVPAGEPVARGHKAAAAAIASGEPTAAERNGEHEIALWKRGVTL